MGASPPTLMEIRRLVRLSLWAALIGVGAWLTIPLPVVPLSLQTFFVLLAGLAEGPRFGAQAAALYLLAGLLGLPVFAGGAGGPSIIFRPTAGYALAFPRGAAVAGLAARRGRPSFGRAFFWALAATIVLHFCGFWGVWLNTGQAPLDVGRVLLVFLPGDLVKIAAAASLASSPRFARLAGGGRP
ncbi:MAG: biotin transporter BioY [Candidatus Adiutrix sp.]|nr:biotin transporter BioY [Candidatus Adiutrix sp.]